MVAELSEAAGSAGMVVGQAIDILCEGKAAIWRSSSYLHARKTGALFLLRSAAAARLGGANQLSSTR